MANRDLAERKPKPEADHTIWSELPQELVEKCLGHLPVLEMASTLRGVSRAWRNYPGTLPFMNLHNHGMNSNSSFGFLMYGTDRLTNRCETMAINHEALEWQMAPSLQLQGNYNNCEVESVSEGLLLLSPRFARPRRIPVPLRSFIVWNPLLGCQQTVPEISSDYTNVNLVVDRASGSFKIVAFSTTYRECLTYSPTISSWHPVNQQEPLVLEGMTFPRQSEFGSRHIAVAHKDCVYVAVASLKNGVHEVGDVSYDVERNAWKPAVMCRVSMSPTRMELYDYCITKSMFVANDMLYKVVEYQTGFRRLHLRPRPTVQILARSLAQANNAGKASVNLHRSGKQFLHIGKCKRACAWGCDDFDRKVQLCRGLGSDCKHSAPSP